VTEPPAVQEPEQLLLGGTPRRRRPKAAAALVSDRPVARVAVDSGLAHLDRPFDYAVPEGAEAAEPGCRVRVRFAGRLVDGVVLERADDTDHQGALAPLSLVSPEPVLSAEVAALCRAVAAGGLVGAARADLARRARRGGPGRGGRWPRRGPRGPGRP
jgi:primosomal protein N' (replication factor Y) (superfamily II helicase)